MEELGERFQAPHACLFAILAQKTVREVMRRYKRVRRRAERLTRRWLAGSTLLELAENEKFPPVLIAHLVLQHMGFRRAAIRNFLRAPERGPDSRLAGELQEVVRADWLYSPRAIREQRQRCRAVEARVREWLLQNRVSFKTEREIKKGPTPDFLFEDFVGLGERDARWLECKAGFCDSIELQKNAPQLQKYVKSFGDGIVVYWYGFVEGLWVPYSEVALCDAAILKARVRKR